MDNETGSAFLILFLIILGIFIWLLPGYIASKRNHAYKNIIWVLAIIAVFNGVTWFVALFWAIWPQEKSLADPIIGNVTGTGTRNMGDTIGSVSTGISQGEVDELILRKELVRAKSLLEQNLITESEYDNKRKQLLNI